LAIVNVAADVVPTRKKHQETRASKTKTLLLLGFDFAQWVMLLICLPTDFLKPTSAFSATE
jgi:hypothetical protein